MKRWNDNQASQRIYSPIQRLATFGGSSGAPATAQFRVPVADARLRSLLVLAFSPPAGSNLTTVATALAITATLWLYGEAEDRSGVSGLILPVSNIEGTKAAPTTFPATGSGLFGYARELVSDVESVGGVFTASGGPAGTWSLQCIYQPEAGAEFSELEFGQIIAQCAPVVLSGPDTVP